MTAGERLIDTNVFVHAYVLLDTRKQPAAREIILPVWQEGGGVTTLQNLCEFFVVSTKKIARPMPVDRAASIVRELLSSEKWRVLDRQEGTVRQAIELVKLYRAPFWDALIAASMLEHGIHTIVTENERDFRRIPGIVIINPFGESAVVEFHLISCALATRPCIVVAEDYANSENSVLYS